MNKENEKFILDGCKIAYHQERLEQWNFGKGKVAPITIDCALTTKCSYRCIYCYGKMQHINQFEHLEKNVILDFLDDAKEIGVKAISFVSDGESTCSPYLVDAVTYGYSLGLDMAVGTNGYLLKDEDIEKILPCLTYLRFNISAGDKDRYCEIHGVKESCYDKVISNIKKSVEYKKINNLDVTIGMQMVLMPEFADQIIPLAKLGKSLGVDYLVIKHCSDDEDNTLGVDYSKYINLVDLLKEAENYSDENYQVSAKWSKILSDGKKNYDKCFGAPFILQMSGNGLVAPCGMLFNEKYKKFHIGNIKEKRFKDIFNSSKYWEVMSYIASDKFDPRIECGKLCLQHKTNEALFDMYNKKEIYPKPNKEQKHQNFI